MTKTTALVAAESQLGVRFPDDYRARVTASDDDAFTGPNEVLHLESVDEVVDRNREERYTTALPDMLVIGDNGGGGIYFYDPQGRLGHGSWALFWANLGDLSLGRARFAGASLTDTLHRIAGGVSFFDEPTI